MKKMKTIIALVLLSLFAVHAAAQTGKQPVTKPAAQKTATKPAVKPAATKTAKPVANAPKQIRIPGVRVKITTDSGVIVVRLYDSTPLHRDNFIKLANEHYFDSLLFHRVMYQFMIQGGDPNSKNAQPGQMLGNGDIGYTLPSEFNPALHHKKGALAAARMPDHVNPDKASSACQFYIVQGRKWTDMDLNNIEMQRPTKYTEAQRNDYKTIGGYPPLDMNYTVFGEVETGLEVIDKIASVRTAPGDRPIGDVRMYIEVIK
jgi:peptidyl-prolyl cis-trans isomerase B (cyclophilin B)